MVDKAQSRSNKITPRLRAVVRERYLFPGLMALVTLNLIVVVIMTLSLYTLTHTRASARQITNTNILLAEIYTNLRDAESGQRGYILTGNPSYLAPYTSGSKNVPLLLQTVKSQNEDPLQAKELATVATLTRQKLQELADTIALYRTQGYAASLTLIDTNYGETVMTKAYMLLTTMENQNNVRINAQNTTANRLVIMSYISLFISFILTVGLVYFVLLLFRQSKRHNAQLEIINAELLRSNRELQDFASVASHDLQEPLRKIQAFGDRLSASSKLSEESQQYLIRMLDAAGRMRILIEDLLAFSRVTTKAKPFRRVNLGRIVREVLSDMEIKIEDTNAEIIVKHLPVIIADDVQMRQLFQNLISNSLKFRRSNTKPMIKIYSTITPSKDHGTAYISVEDNGIGFDEKYLDRIFTIFQRLHGRTDYEGTGIGLAVVRKIAERHNGTVTAESRPGHGARFIVELPVEQVNNT